MIASGSGRQFRIAVRKYPAFESAIKAQWNAFEAHAHTGLELEIVALDLEPLQETLFTSQGMRSGEWDIAFVNTDWIAAIERQEAVLDLAPLLASDPPPGWPEGWAPSLRRLQSVGDKVLGIPYHDGPECLILRADLFDDPGNRHAFKAQFGRALAPPETWDDFHQIARFFHDPARNLFGTGFAAFADGHNTVYDFLLQLWTRGGELLDAYGNVQFDTPHAEETLSFYREILSDSAAVHPRCRELDSVGLGAAFAAGELAMAVNWFGFATAAHTSEQSFVKERVDVAPIPRGVSGKSVSLNVYWILAVPSGSTRPQIAWSFLRHVMNPEMDRLTTFSGAIGCRRSTWADPEINRLIPFYHRMDALHQSAREVPARIDWPEIARTIDLLVTRAITTSIPIRQLLVDAQHA